MNMPPISQEHPCAAPLSCLCGQSCPRESFYCSLECAREDAFNSLTLGKPHESSNPPMAPLPTLPPGFFKLPPKRLLDEADELAFAPDDYGPFQARPSTRAKDRMTRTPKSVPRSITTSGASNTASKRSKSSSKWRSHYQKIQQHDRLNSSIDIPFFLVDEVDGAKEDRTLGISAVAENDSLALPTPTPEPRRQAQSTALLRGGSFGLISPSYPSLTCTEADSLTPYEYTTDTSKRHSSSSYNSLLTSGTSQSSHAEPSDPSPTTSEYAASLSRSQPRLGYGSAFGGHEDKELMVEAVQIAADIGNSMLLAKRANRKRSSTDATLLLSERHGPQQELRKAEPPPAKDDVSLVKPLDDTEPPARPLLPCTPPKATKPVPRFGTLMSRSEQRPTATTPAIPMQSHVVNSPSPRSIPGTVVKKTTIASKGRLPIGTAPQAPPRPKTPSNVTPATLNLSLHSKSFCAPAYAMSAPKIPISTRPLRTSPSKKSLKKEEGHIRIPSIGADEARSIVGEGFKASFQAAPPTDTQGSKEANDALVVNDRDLASSAQSGSAFKLCTAPKPTSKPTLHLDSASLHPLSAANLDDVTPRASPSGTQDRSPSTAGGPLTPRATPVGANRPSWLVSPTDTTALDAQPDFFTTSAIQQTTRLASSASNAGDLLSSGDDEIAHAQLCVARKMTLKTSPSSLRTTFDWGSAPMTAVKI